MDGQAIQGLVLLCDQAGVARELVRDDLNVETSSINHPFICLLDESSHTKGLRFISELQSDAPIVDEELCFAVVDIPRVLSVAGIRIGGDTLIAAANTSSALRSMCIEVAVQRKDLSEALLKLLAAFDRNPSAVDTEVYEEQTRMYNDFARLQRKIASQNAKLTRLSSEKDLVLDMAAHDLRNPLNSIALLATSLSASAISRLTEEERRALERIDQTARDMGILINKLLGSERSSAGLSDLNRSEADIGSFIRRRLEFVTPLAGAKSIRLKVEIPDEPQQFHIDIQRMQQVIDNLLGNAIKFAAADSEVTVIAKVADSKLQLSVCDRGPGIAEDQLAQIFQPFFRGSHLAPSGDIGNGLGLAICRSIVNAHNGKIWAENRKGGGTAVHVVLPANSHKGATGAMPQRTKAESAVKGSDRPQLR